MPSILDSPGLQVKVRRQGDDGCRNLCWAYVTAGISSYFGGKNPGHKIWTECDLTNWAFNRADCCGPQAIRRCDEIFRFQKALDQAGHLKAPPMQGAMSENAILAELDSGAPVCVSLKWLGLPANSPGHVVVIIGAYKNTSGKTVFQVADPNHGISGWLLSDLNGKYGHFNGKWEVTLTTKPGRS